MITLSLSSIVTMMIDLASRNHRHLNLYVLPTPKDLCLRYFFSAGTGIFLFVIYVTGDELKWTWYEFLKHSAMKRMKKPCRCRRCVCGESAYTDIVDPITTLPIGMARSSSSSASSEADDSGNEEEEAIDFFAALRASAGVRREKVTRSTVKVEGRQRTFSVDSILTPGDVNSIKDVSMV
jgi:hypothetical protein